LAEANDVVWELEILRGFLKRFSKVQRNGGAITGVDEGAVFEWE